MENHAIAIAVLLILLVAQAFWLGYRVKNPPKPLKTKRFRVIRGGKKDG
jgi:hypothetical protein